MTPVISIVLPTYNRAHIIKSSIACVLQQSFRDFELIVADDCSTDSTERVIMGYDDPRIRYIRSEKNCGAAATRNLGASIAKGVYLAFCDSDTLWSPDKLEKQMEYLETHPDVSLVFHSFISIKEDKNILEPNQDRLSGLSTHIFFDLLTGPLIDTPSILMYKDVFCSVNGFLETLRSHEDYEFSLRIAKDYEIGCIKDPLLRSYHSDAGVNSNYHEILRTNFYILNLYADVIANDSHIEAAQLERLFYYTILGNDGQYFFDELAQYVILTGHRDLYYRYEKLYNDVREQFSCSE